MRKNYEEPVITVRTRCGVFLLIFSQRSAFSPFSFDL